MNRRGDLHLVEAFGSELSVKHERPNGERWRSGTEFELVTAVESKKARGTPDISIFKNDTKPNFEAEEAGKGAKVQADLDQWKELIAFIEEWSEGVQDGQRIFTASCPPSLGYANPPPCDCSNAGACIEYGNDPMTEVRRSFSLRDSISVPRRNPINRIPRPILARPGVCPKCHRRRAKRAACEGD
jgi:hypothetical protein